LVDRPVDRRSQGAKRRTKGLGWSTDPYVENFAAVVGRLPGQSIEI